MVEKWDSPILAEDWHLFINTASGKGMLQSL